MKRFELELGDKMQYFLDEQTMRAVAFTGKAHAKLAIAYGGANSSRPMDIVDVDDFIGVKSHRAKGKRITTFEVETLTFIEPEKPAEEPIPEAEDDAGMTQDAVDAVEGFDPGDMLAEDIDDVSDIDYTAEGGEDDDFSPEQLNLF